MDMVSDLWTFMYPIGYNGKIELWPLNFFLKGDGSDLTLDSPSSIYLKRGQVWQWTPGPSGLKTICLFKWKTHWFPLKMSIVTVTLAAVNLIWLMYVDWFFNQCIYNSDKNLRNPKVKVYVNFKSLKYEIWDPGDLENNVKVKLKTYTKNSCHFPS